MAFRGENEHNLDSKDRLTIPSRHRAQLSEGVVLMRTVDSCVHVYPKDAFEAFAERTLRNVNPLSKQGRHIKRLLHSSSEDEKLDSAGRVRIPRKLIDHAGLSGTCTVIGVDDHLEVWHPERWAAEALEIEATAESLIEALGPPGPGAA